MKNPYDLKPGGAWRRPGAYEVGSDRVVTVTAQVARRCVFMRLSYFGGPGTDDEAVRLCAVFKDPKTGHVYAQPVE